MSSSEVSVELEEFTTLLQRMSGYLGLSSLSVFSSESTESKDSLVSDMCSAFLLNSVFRAVSSSSSSSSYRTIFVFSRKMSGESSSVFVLSDMSVFFVVSLLCLLSSCSTITVSSRKESTVSSSLFALSSVDLVGEAGSYCRLVSDESLKVSALLCLRMKSDTFGVKFLLVLAPDTSVVVLVLSLRIFWLGRLLVFTRTFLRLLLPVGEVLPVQPEVEEEGAGVGAGAGGGGGAAAGGAAARGVGLPGGGVVFGTRRDCAVKVSRRALTMLFMQVFLFPGLFSGQFA